MRSRIMRVHGKETNLVCECGSELQVYELLREGERPKTILCCEKSSCLNSARATAGIHRAELEEGEGP